MNELISKTTEYKFSGIVILMVLFFSSIIFQDPLVNEQSGRVKGVSNIMVGIESFGKTNDFSVGLENRFSKAQAFISAVNNSTLTPSSSDPLHTIQGEFKDVTGDGRKEWVVRENWQGASGWSDKYTIYQVQGLRLRSIYELYASNSVLIFEKGNIYHIEPYWEEGRTRAEIDKLIITIESWNGEAFEQTGQELYPISTPSFS